MKNLSVFFLAYFFSSFVYGADSYRKTGLYQSGESELTLRRVSETPGRYQTYRIPFSSSKKRDYPLSLVTKAYSQCTGKGAEFKCLKTYVHLDTQRGRRVYVEANALNRFIRDNSRFSMTPREFASFRHNPKTQKKYEKAYENFMGFNKVALRKRIYTAALVGGSMALQQEAIEAKENILAKALSDLKWYWDKGYYKGEAAEEMYRAHRTPVEALVLRFSEAQAVLTEAIRAYWSVLEAHRDSDLILGVNGDLRFYPSEEAVMNLCEEIRGIRPDLRENLIAARNHLFRLKNPLKDIVDRERSQWPKTGWQKTWRRVKKAARVTAQIAVDAFNTTLEVAHSRDGRRP